MTTSTPDLAKKIAELVLMKGVERKNVVVVRNTLQG